MSDISPPEDGGQEAEGVPEPAQKAGFDPYTGEPVPGPDSAREARFDPFTGKPLTTVGRAPLWKRKGVMLGAGVGDGIAVVVVLFAFVLHSGPTVIPRPHHELTITVDLTNSPGGCNVADTGFDDLSAGAPVTVKDAKGTVVASSSLPEGIGLDGVCHFSLKVRVPDTSFYQVEVSRRGTVTFTKSELAASGWTAPLTIGG